VFGLAGCLCYDEAGSPGRTELPREIIMESTTMGRVLTEAIIENVADLFEVKRGHRKAEDVRRVTVPDALVDTGATTLSIPASIARQLGLAVVSTKRTTTAVGHRDANMLEAVRLTIMGRECTLDALEVPDGVPVLIGQIPLEFLDLVVDPHGQKLIGNPAHGGEQMFEMY
jgi:clan AA aspartic protease